VTYDAATITDTGDDATAGKSVFDNNVVQLLGTSVFDGNSVEQSMPRTSEFMIVGFNDTESFGELRSWRGCNRRRWCR